MPHERKNDAWDRLFDPEALDRNNVADEASGSDQQAADTVKLSSVLASSWGDLVIVASLTTGLLAGVVLFGYPLGFEAFPWAVAVSFAWWVTASAILVRVRRATPGMLVAGVAFADQVEGGRVIGVVAVAGIGFFLLGLPLILGGSSRSLLPTAAGSRLIPHSQLASPV